MSYVEWARDNWQAVAAAAGAAYALLRIGWLKSKASDLLKYHAREVEQLKSIVHSWEMKCQKLECSKPTEPPQTKPEKVQLLETFQSMLNDMTDGVDDEYLADIIEKCTASFNSIADRAEGETP